MQGIGCTHDGDAEKPTGASEATQDQQQKTNGSSAGGKGGGGRIVGA